MKQVLPVIVCCCVLMGLYSCGRAGDTSNRNGARPKTYSKAAFHYPLQKLEGAYTGDFGGSPIRILLRHISPMHAVGYNLHLGLRRNVSGSVEAIDKGVQFTLSEPGDDPYDGVFTFCIDTITYEAKGDWKPKDKAGASDKRFTLKRDWGDTSKSRVIDPILYWEEGDNRLTFSSDGVCRYSYYPTGKLQMEEVSGSWTKKSNVFLVFWEKNDVFPNGKTIFTKNEDSMIITTAGHRFSAKYDFP